jgi:hypothetical protein
MVSIVRLRGDDLDPFESLLFCLGISTDVELELFPEPRGLALFCLGIPEPRGLTLFCLGIREPRGLTLFCLGIRE